MARYSHYIFTLLLSIIFIVTVWETKYRVDKDFLQHQHELAQVYTQSMAQKLGIYLAGLRQSVKMFADEHLSDFVLDFYPDQRQGVRQRIEASLKEHFPNYYTFDIVQAPFKLDTLNVDIGKACRIDLATQLRFPHLIGLTRIHRGPHKKHIDVMVPWQYGVDSGVFFVSFSVKPLITYFQKKLHPGHELFVLLNDGTSLIELSKDMDEKNLASKYLSQSQQASVIRDAQTTVRYSKWRVVDVLSEDYVLQYFQKTRYIALALSFWFGLFAVLYLIQVHRRRLRRQQWDDLQLKTQARLEQQVEERTQALKNIAYVDPLTQLPNQSAFQEALEQKVQQAHSEKVLSVCLVDMDNLRNINALYGKAAGDVLIKKVALRMAAYIKGDSVLARKEGGAFLLLLEDVSEEVLNERIEAIHRAFELPFAISEDNLLHLTCSFGVTFHHFREKEEVPNLLRQVELTMYRAKGGGRNQVAFYDARKGELNDDKLSAQRAEVRKAIQQGQMCLFYQPKVNIATGEVIGFEALVRWQHPQKGLLMPGQFLPAIEQTEVMIDLGRWGIEQVMQKIAAFQALNQDFVVSVNIASNHLLTGDFLAELKEILAKYPAEYAQFLEIELLESTAMYDSKRIAELILACQKLGVQFSLDDFGTGYSSLSHLKQMPANTIKIDQSFIREMLQNKDDMAIVEAVISMSNAFNRKTIAEGVETFEHGIVLLRLGCPLVQGYYISRPLPESAIAKWLKKFEGNREWSEWEQSDWDLKHIPLICAKADHVAWVDDIIQCVEKGDKIGDLLQISNHQQCRFGKWYYSEGMATFSQEEAFIALEKLHVQIHRLGIEIIQKMQLEDTVDLNHDVTELLSLREGILEKLKQLERVLVARV